MGNPRRYIFQENQFTRIVSYPDVEKKEIIITGDKDFKDFYETAKIDFYSAPDLIMSYSNGNTCKDEWRRYWRWEFTNFTLKNKIDDIQGDFHLTYTFDEFKDIVFHDDSEMTANVPMGKFAGMTPKQVENYKRKNQMYFKGQFPKPSKEAVEAAFKAQSALSIEEIEKVLIEAYKLDI
jgi:hypothetical protein